MPFALCLIVSCVICHWFLSSIAPAWWVPDLTLIGLVLAVGRRSEKWVFPACAAGILSMCWIVEGSIIVLLWYVGVGFSVSMLSRLFDVGTLRFQLLAAGIFEALWLILHLWLQQVVPTLLITLMGIHIVMTLFGVYVVRRLLAARKVFA